ncbi:ATP-binding protein [Arabiibacter massiliensis]|uniref:ATP-binding protein n=1 Tax=Arabiibacter massiliensis TaxID=1870985 RepID=UPI0009BBAAFA|nr:ATP-binding protein [Arabiibacter massiliensis]
MLETDLQHLVANIQEMQAEMQTVEVKKAHDGCPKRLFDTLSSFSNQDEGGVIVFGLDETNAYKCVGVYDVQDLQKSVTEQCNQMDPVVRPLFSVCKVGDSYVVSAEIPALDLSDRPCYYKGKGKTKGSYKRVGEADELMTEYEIYSYESFRKKYQDDIRVVPNADLASLDEGLLEEYLVKLKRNKPNLGKLDRDRILDLMGVTRDGGVSLYAEWMFGLYPQAFIPQLCIVAVSIPGEEMGETGPEGERFIDNRRIEGTIPDMLKESLVFVRGNMKTKTVIDPATGERQDIPEYPVEAIREIVLNALVHRDYSVHTEGMPIQIRMFADRIEVSNPGGLYGRLRVDQLGKVQPDTRNPALATAMETLGLTENRYSGIPTVLRLMRQAGLPQPEFVDTHDSFTVVLRKAPAAQAKADDTEKEPDLAAFCSVPRSRAEIAEFLGLASTPYATRVYIMPAVQEGRLRMTIPDKPRSSRQRYVAARLP